MTRYEQYLICQQRNHEPSGVIFQSLWKVCRHCGTYYRMQEMVVEQNAPEENE